MKRERKLTTNDNLPSKVNIQTWRRDKEYPREAKLKDFITIEQALQIKQTKNPHKNTKKIHNVKRISLIGKKVKNKYREKNSITKANSEGTGSNYKVNMNVKRQKK